MRLAKNFLMGIGGFALVMGAGLLVAPQRARALAATLVQVANTASAPAVTQDVSKLAAEASQFWCPTSASGMCLTFPGGNGARTLYTIPPGQTLMITSVDFVYGFFTSAPATGYFLHCGSPLFNGTLVGEWSLAGGTAPTQFIYPSGFSVPSGCAITVSTFAGVPSNYDVIVRGYLTTN